MSMGVYIDIEMPKGELGAIPIMIYANGAVEHFFSHEKYGKAIEVPEPHGRLIDADALDVVLENEAESFGYDVYSCGITDALALARSCIETAPTIIPASEEAECE
jgi:hypothetical protein